MAAANRTLPAFFRAHAPVFVVTALTGGFMAAVGAFDTETVPLGMRLGYWMVVMLAGGLIGAGVTEAFDRAGGLASRPWSRVAAVVLIMTPPQTLAVWTASRLIFAGQWDPAQLVPLLPAVLIVSAAVMTVDHLVRSRTPPAPAADEKAPPSGQARFLERLPPKLRGGELYAVEAEDHYSRLHTSRGSDLILMRFSAAISELEGVEGAQTHRSWWVARAGVCGGRGVGRRAVLILKSGVEAPVSRANVAALRRAGWF